MDGEIREAAESLVALVEDDGVDLLLGRIFDELELHARCFAD
jgi:hypothetical protein